MVETTCSLCGKVFQSDKGDAPVCPDCIERATCIERAVIKVSEKAGQPIVIEN